MITDEGSVPEMRIWSILLIKSDIKNGVYILVEVSYYTSAIRLEFASRRLPYSDVTIYIFDI